MKDPHEAAREGSVDEYWRGEELAMPPRRHPSPSQIQSRVYSGPPIPATPPGPSSALSSDWRPWAWFVVFGL